MRVCPETGSPCQQRCRPGGCKRASVFEVFDYIDRAGQPQVFPPPGEPYICWYCGQGYTIRDTGYICACLECDSVLRAYEALITVEHMRRHLAAEEMRCLLRDCQINRELRREFPRPALG